MENNNYKNAEDQTLVTILNRANELIQKSRKHLNQNALKNLINNIDNLQKQDIVIGKSATERDNKEVKEEVNQTLMASKLNKQQKIVNNNIQNKPIINNQHNQNKNDISVISKQKEVSENQKLIVTEKPQIQQNQTKPNEDTDYFFENFDTMIKVNFSNSPINNTKNGTIRKSLQRDFESQIQNERTVKKVAPPRINSISNLEQKVYIQSQPDTCLNQQKESQRSQQDNSRRSSQLSYQGNYNNNVQQGQKQQLKQGNCGSFVGNSQNLLQKDKENQPQNNQKLFYKPPPKLDHSRINSFALYGERLNTVGENNFIYNGNSSFFREDLHPLNVTNNNNNFSSRSQVSFNNRPQFQVQSVIGQNFIGPRSSSLPRGAIIMPSRIVY